MSPTPTFPPEYPEILIDLAQLICQRLADLLPPVVAEDLTRELVEDIRLKWGGGLIYIPRGSRYERKQRDAKIWREFNGRNHAQLASRYGLTLSCVYDILARERLLRQGEILFRSAD